MFALSFQTLLLHLLYTNKVGTAVAFYGQYSLYFVSACKIQRGVPYMHFVADKSLLKHYVGWWQYHCTSVWFLSFLSSNISLVANTCVSPPNPWETWCDFVFFLRIVCLLFISCLSFHSIPNIVFSTPSLSRLSLPPWHSTRENNGPLLCPDCTLKLKRKSL